MIVNNVPQTPFLSKSETDTERFGKELALSLGPGTLVTLDGDLGTGKTTLVAAIAEAWGVPRHTVQSPTYVLLRCYLEGRIPIYHWDFYRIADGEELMVTDFRELLLERSAIVLIEWASRFRQAWEFFLPRCEITITEGDEHGTRVIDLLPRE